MQARPLIAVVGAGIAGQTAAAVLSGAGALVTVYDKGRGAGGRLATRRDSGLQWDHGAQYFTARDPALKALLASLTAKGLVAPWRGNIGTLGPAGFVPGSGAETRFVGTPRMSALVGALGSGATVYNIEIRDIATRGSMLTLTDRHGEHFGPYDAVVVATPAPQAVPLLALVPPLASRAAGVDTVPCWALMLAFDRPLGLPFDGAFVDPALARGMIGWIACDSGKPSRPAIAGETWVVHASPEWSEAHVEAPPGVVAPLLLAGFAAVTGSSATPHTALTHCWRHAMTTRPAGLNHLLDSSRPIGACGDWCLGARIEGAFLSGHSLGDALVERLGLRPAHASSSASQ